MNNTADSVHTDTATDGGMTTGGDTRHTSATTTTLRALTVRVDEAHCTSVTDSELDTSVTVSSDDDEHHNYDDGMADSVQCGVTVSDDDAHCNVTTVSLQSVNATVGNHAQNGTDTTATDSEEQTTNIIFSVYCSESMLSPYGLSLTYVYSILKNDTTPTQ